MIKQNMGQPSGDASCNWWQQMALQTAEQFLEANNYVAAAKCYEKSLTGTATDEEALKALMVCYKLLHYHQAALHTYQRMLNLNAFDATLYIKVSELHIEMAQFDKAEKSLRTALKLSPQCVDAQLALASLYELLEQTEQAIPIYETLCQQHPDFLLAKSNLASAYYRCQQYHRAESLYRYIIKTSPDYTQAYLGLATVLDSMGKTTESLKHYLYLLSQKGFQFHRAAVLKRVNSITTQQNQRRYGLAKPLVRMK